MDNSAFKTIKLERIRSNGAIGDIEDYVTTIAFDWISNQLYLGVEQARSIWGQIEVCSTSEILSKCTILLHKNLKSLNFLIVDPIDR